jgi:hypothetical protein
MGNIVVFPREANPGPLGATNGCRQISCESKDLRALPESDMPQGTQTDRLISQISLSIFRHFGLTPFAPVKLATKPDPDAFLLVLLADQEFTAGRDDEARSLLDAAYAAFDRQTENQPGCFARG